MYELPEIVEVGPAAGLTRGMGPTAVSDACDCTKKWEEIPMDDPSA